MGILTETPLRDFPQIRTCNDQNDLLINIPTINLQSQNATDSILKACEGYGFFKVVNHGVPFDLVSEIESESIKFFSLDQTDKEMAGPASPFGYGNTRIGPNGDIGWIEYLLFTTNTESVSKLARAVCRDNPEHFGMLINECVSKVRELVCNVLERIADGFNIEQRDLISKLLKVEKSDSYFRINHYPSCLDDQQLQEFNLIGFGEHTDPQILSALRSNNTYGLQIALQDGTWVSVPPDNESFFLNVGDCLQAMTNGRFKSVKHRVLAQGLQPRVSMIYFGSPAVDAEIRVIPSLMKQGEKRLYKDFTWGEFKRSAYNSKLADNRLNIFEKKVASQDVPN